MVAAASSGGPTPDRHPMRHAAINLQDKFARFAERWSPRGVEHRPVADEECKVMLVEPRGVVNTGAAGGGYTAPHDVRV